MRRLALALLLLTLPAAAGAADTATIALEMPVGLVQQACPARVWKNTAVVWKGVTDKRPAPEVGVQTQKNKAPIPVMAEPPIDKAFDVALRQLLPACGMTFAEKAGANALQLSAEVREFSTSVEKKLVTGKSEARSAIAFQARQGNRSTSVTVGYEMTSKKVRSGDIKQLTQTLNELFAETLKQIPATPEMRELK